jgi:hypothetical protein
MVFILPRMGIDLLGLLINHIVWPIMQLLLIGVR